MSKVLEHGGGVNAVSFSPNGSQLATGCWDSLLRVWDVATWDVLRVLEGHTYEVSMIWFF